MQLSALCQARPRRGVFLNQTWKIMRLTSILLLVAVLHVSAGALSQKVTLSAEHISLEKALTEIKQQTGYSFFWNDQLIAAAPSISLHLKDATLAQALDACLYNLPFSYEIKDQFVYIKPKKESMPQPVMPLLSDIHGHITDSLGNPLAGASVVVKGRRRGTQTDAKGNFNLKGVDSEATLYISFTGYEPREIKLNGRTDISVNLARSTSQLDAVQVIPYGTTTQRLNTGDVTTVTSKEIEQQPVSNPLEALEGRVPGLLITQTTGLPGGSFKVQIRGQNSITNGNAPFYVIDGVPYNSQLPGAPINSYLYGGSPLNFINPYDIETIEVLKDADATAIYGSRAANGAILITTKKGKVGNMKFDLNLKSGFTTPARTIPVLNTQQYLAMRQEAFKNDGRTPKSGDHDINGDWDTTRNTNWANVMANKLAQYTDAEAAVSGGNITTQYLVGAGYLFSKTGFPTILPGDGGDKKGSVHFNINTLSPDKRFRLSLTGSYIADKNTVQSQDFTRTGVILPPDAPSIFNPDGSLNWAPLAPGQRGTWTNPYAVLNATIVSNNSNLVSNAVMSYSILKGLELRASLGYTNTQTDEVQTVPTTIYDPARKIPSGHSTFNTMNMHSWIIEPQADYRLQMGRGVFSALIGASFLENNTNAASDNATNFVSDALLGNLQAAGQVSVSSSSAQYKYEAIFGRIGYDWMDKYLINITARRDGTTRFGPGKQFGNFGAIGAAWIFTKENFVQRNIGFLSFGKLRGSYGTTGNDQVGDYQFIDLYSPTYGSYQGNPGLHPTNLFNASLAWETTTKLEGGIELGFFRDRMRLQASFYQNRSGNELVQTPVSVVTGFQSIFSNLPALVQNTGKEFVLTTANIRAKNFSWSSSFHLTIARNKLLSFPNLASSTYASQLVIGQPITVLQLYHCIGVNDTTGLYEFASAKTGPTYSPNYLTDLTALLDLTPKFYGGFQNNFSYKGFSLDVFFQLVKQTGLKLWAANGLIPGLMFNQPTNVLNRWQNPGDKKPYQRFTQDYGSKAASTFGYAQQSDFSYGDASYIRLKNLAISWQMPQALVRKMRLANFRIYMQGQNLLTITKYEGLDPESQSALTGPRRAYVAGVQVGW